ncbi:CopD family protein [Candidatus Sulfurimonas baltica]|uniref:Protoporphyrinogen IX oxidase n=1 Tax=Candidatus Sulfurimonas baltica TaxID=2740404 RepID=A0A7S7LUD8_9BACT|nr:CopD family protein [Candidatus Sulfurimonas baltica]QOY51646.1 CopD family protein [Candidatus Sulfurimonas baltica]
MYSWIIWFHILSFTSWFAVLFYMPRLFVYHAENIDNKGFVEVVKVMEMKIYKYIGVPAMWATLLTGAYMSYEIGLSGNAWLHAKILFVAFLIAYFFSMDYFRKQFLEDKCFKSGKYFRIYNEVPTLLILVIVGMVIFKPF